MAPPRFTPPDARVEIRPADPSEYAAVGDLTARVYVDGGLIRTDSPYVEELRAAGARAAGADLLVAVAAGRIIGSVTFALAGSPWAELAGVGEAEFRMLVVDPATRGSGIGARLVEACRTRAVTAGCSALVLSTQPQMHAAHRIYERLGFRRQPERDWSPAPGIDLLAYRIELPARTAAAPPDRRDPESEQEWCEQCGRTVGEGDHEPCMQRRVLEPPRYCRSCGRRMVVQVTPRGWTARCSRHGLLDSSGPPVPPPLAFPTSPDQAVRP